METETFQKHFDYQNAERRIWALWEKHRIFDATVDKTKQPFCVVMPPPNVTGILHMGHVLDNIPQDVMTRWHRMRGFAALWVPGTDHAGIATQNVVKRQLDKEGIDYRSLGREKFIERVWDWKEKSGGIIIDQLKRLGCSCDWTRERFTMDEKLSHAVIEAFVQLYNKGLVYRGKRMINWCTVCGTALANDEVDHVEKKGSIWYIRYPLLDTTGHPTEEFLVLATTRPETLLGDVAVAVHPEDERYLKLHGRKVLLPIQKRAIPIICDDFVDRSFGSGVVKITPAHDPNDYQVGLRHKLTFPEAIGLDGSIVAGPAEYTGLDRFKAREKIVQQLESDGLLERVENHKNNVGQCYRCESVVEPLVSDQWFIKMKPLAEKAKQAVLDGRIEIVPQSEKNDYFHWMDTIDDWCISRQLWWGHRIPAYYCCTCGEIQASSSAPASCPKCGGSDFRQDEDVLDTWFSSQLWPFSTLGWPEKTEELDYWYPNSWLISGRDILFFWDARMIIAGLELAGDVPFRKLILHGLVRDEQGRKLSKSLGNSPDPLKLFDEYGADGVRAAILSRYPLGRQDTRLGENQYKNGVSFITKLWNSCRFILMNLENGAAGYQFSSAEFEPKSLEDRWILAQLRQAIERHDGYLNASDLTRSFDVLVSFFWGEVCDWYLEIIKGRLGNAADNSRGEAFTTVLIVLRNLLKALHPYIPFVTEELWQIFQQNNIVDTALSGDSPILALTSWPELKSVPSNDSADLVMNDMMTLVRGVREVRSNLNIAPKLTLDIKLSFFSNDGTKRFEEYQAIAKYMGFLGQVVIHEASSAPLGHVPFRFESGVGYVALPEDIKLDETKKVLEGRITKLKKSQEQLIQRLADSNFLNNAPPETVEESKTRASELEQTIDKLHTFWSSLR